jgi:hypothetical protein
LTPILDTFPANTDNLRTFWYWVSERQMIYHRRFELHEMPPWTDDRILRSYHFCNVYRELDRGTLFLTQQVLPHVKTPQEALWQILIYRYFNNIATYQFLADRFGDNHIIGDVWDHTEVAKALTTWERQENTVFTNAFTVTGIRFGGYPDKIRNVCFLMEHLQKQLQETYERIEKADTFRQLYYVFRGLDGYGAFLAFQVAVDYAYYDTTFDRDSFAEPGPGCRNGLRWIYPNIRGMQSFEKMIYELTASQEEAFNHFELPFPRWQDKRIVASDIENCLCEFSKYIRLKTGHRLDGSAVTAGGKTRRFEARNRIEVPLL